jgi:hypothetical protein
MLLNYFVYILKIMIIKNLSEEAFKQFLPALVPNIIEYMARLYWYSTAFLFEVFNQFSTSA